MERLTTTVTVEPCQETDFEDYYAIRCGESDIFWMGYDGPPARETMEEVFLSRLGGNRLEQPGDKRIHMIKANGKNVGFIQFSLSDEGLEFGYSVLDSERGKGYGLAGMKCAVKIARQISYFCFAHIRDDNIVSQKAMMKAGFKPTDDVVMKSFPKTGIVRYRKYILEDQQFSTPKYIEKPTIVELETIRALYPIEYSRISSFESMNSYS